MPEPIQQRKKAGTHKLASVLVPPLAYSLIKLVGGTQKLTVINQAAPEKVFQERGNAIFAFWHNNFMMIPYLYRRLWGMKDIITLISQSQDGEFLVQGLKWFRPYIVRGSSSRGGSTALRQLVKEMSTGKDCIITPDGPRGPRYEVQGGIATLSLLSQTPIIPVCYDSSRKKNLNNWDGTIITLPFGKTVLAFGNPVYPAADRKSVDLDQFCQHIKENMMQTMQVVESQF